MSPNGFRGYRLIALSFTGLATAISSNEDYTVELFVKLDPADKPIHEVLQATS